MSAMIGLLRGINVGRANRLAMADLRAIAESCGYTEVATYIQSGNLVFAAGVAPAEAAERLSAAVAEHMGKPIAVAVRTSDELDALVADNPFLARGADPDALHVSFGIGDTDAVVPLDDLTVYAPASAIAVGREIYLHLPEGIGRSKLMEDLGRRKAPIGTVRNWRTVTKLAEMAGGLA